MARMVVLAVPITLDLGTDVDSFMDGGVLLIRKQPLGVIPLVRGQQS